jgi:hypothetical protein
MAEVINPPLAISLHARLAVTSLPDAASIAFSAVQGGALPSIAKWSIPNTGRRRRASLGQLPPELTPEGARPELSTAIMELDDGSIGSLFQSYDERDWGFTLRVRLPDDDPASAPRILAGLRTVCRTLLHDPRVIRVSLDFMGAGALCLPTVPIADVRTYLVSCTKREVADAYGSPEAFWKSGWEASQWIGERAMLERAMRTMGSVDYLAHVQPQHWALARAAKPGRCEYALPVVEPEEQEVYRAGAPALALVGYADREAEVELACALKPPAHVQGYEVFDLYGLREAGVLEDGRPVRGIRVVFSNEEMARAERRPLLDIGVRVLAYDKSGRLQEITE